LLRAGGAIRSVPLCFYLSAVAGAVFYSLQQLQSAGRAHPLLRLRQVVVVLVLATLPSLIDGNTLEVFNLPRLVLLVVAATVILADWAVDWVWSGWRPRRLVNGFQWLLLATVVWFGITTLTSVEPRSSFLGRSGAYEGFILIAALAVLASAIAESFGTVAISALFRVIVASAVPVIVYGLIQLYGFVINKHSTWDFVHYRSELHNVFASLGNPNHLAGFLVTILPIGIATALLARKRLGRVVAWVWVALVIGLILQTAARGAWLGGLAGGAVLVIALFDRVRARARVVIPVAIAALLAAFGLVAGGSRFLGSKASALFHFGSGSSVSQRFGYWSAALRLAAHHPLTGTGPDTYQVMYTRYQDATLARSLGTTVVNGPHNIFLAWLANEGIPGFLLIVALFAFGIAWAIKAYRLRGRVNGNPGRDRIRYMTAALLAAVVAYFIQASFDVEQVSTLFMLFTVVGLLGAINRSHWATQVLLRLPLRGSTGLAATTVGADDSGYPIASNENGSDGGQGIGSRRLGTTFGTYISALLGNPAARRSAWGGQRFPFRIFTGSITAVLGIFVIAIVSWKVDALWRADHDAQSGNFVQATQLNPWEPSYLQDAGAQELSTYNLAPNASNAIQRAAQGVSYMQQAVALDGYSFSAQVVYGKALGTFSSAQGNNKATAQMAIAAFEQAKKDDPFDSEIPGLIRSARALIGG
jgi:O-antigen ligase